MPADVTGTRRHLAANMLYSGAAVYVEYAAAFLISIVVARQLGPAGYGTYTLLMWIGLVAVALANHGLLTGVMKFVGESRGQAGRPAGEAVFRYFERLQVISVAAVCLAAALAVIVVPPRVADIPPLLWVLVPAVCARSLYLFYLAAAKGFENFRAGALAHAWVAPASVILVLSVSSAGGSLRAFVYAYAATAVAYLVAMRQALVRGMGLRQPVPAAVPRRRIARHVMYASAIVVIELAVLRQPEIAFLAKFASPADVAHFGLGRSLSASAMLLVPGVMTALLVPVMSRTFGEAPAMLGRRFLAATRYILILVVPVVALIELFAADLVLLLYGVEYAPAITVFRVTAAAAAIGAVSASASSFQLGTDRQPAIVVIMAAVASITLVLDYVLIRAYGLDGAIAAAATSSILLGGALLWHAGNALGVGFQWPVYARVVAAGAAAMAPAAAMRAVAPSWIAIPAGSLLAVLAYAALSVVLRVWTRRDLETFLTMADAVPAVLQPGLVRFLRWAVHGAPMAGDA